MKAQSSRIATMVMALAIVLAACSGEVVQPNDPGAPAPEIVVPGDPIEGAKTYRSVCATCHGADLGGVVDLGGPLLPSPFITEKTDEELIAFLIEGRPIDHPDNITGVAMLPRGGNPVLTDQDMANIVAYIKRQQ